ncbi:hypothetical protein BCR33DRAFT_720397 [Rhizoclosmatium globosum]|uniref:G-protein coupled receptors family 2 profile 2 domain-containing protein n=1 Tax=Rhizoclosmatium globosum TaxID=329046 RepID=A0A1Y2BWX1_9FUNG|nr:hypothetical protein BCR33DRAFT_720397 [Rhizoclosmatium globosum]|eukprot:ORY39164.1 hypothetical protein BCR33DRAFT_720397 [Rhizoclosmatium globosum]
MRADQLHPIELMLWIICPISCSLASNPSPYRPDPGMDSRLGNPTRSQLRNRNELAWNHAICTFLGGLTEFFFVTTASWHFNASLLCWMLIKHGSNKAKKYWPLFHIYAWGSGSWDRSTRGGEEDVMGDALIECWFGPLYPDLRIWCFYIWLWLQFLLITAWGTEHSLHTTEISSQSHGELFETSQSNLDVLGTVKEGEIVDSSVQEKHTTMLQSVKADTLDRGLNRSKSRAEIVCHKEVTAVDPPVMVIQKRTNLSRIVFRGGIIGLSFLISWTPPTALRVFGLLNWNPPEWLAMLGGLGLATSGLWNPIIYFYFRRSI